MALFIAPSPLRGLALKAVRSRTLCKTRKLVPTQRPQRTVAFARIFLHAQNPALPKGVGCPIITHETTVSFLLRIQKNRRFRAAFNTSRRPTRKIQYSINHAAPHFLAILKIGAFELPLTRNEDLGEIGPSLTLCVELGRNGPGGIYHLGPHSLNE